MFFPPHRQRSPEPELANIPVFRRRAEAGAGAGELVDALDAARVEGWHLDAQVEDALSEALPGR